MSQYVYDSIVFLHTREQKILAHKICAQIKNDSVCKVGVIPIGWGSVPVLFHSLPKNSIPRCLWPHKKLSDSEEVGI